MSGSRAKSWENGREGDERGEMEERQGGREGGGKGRDEEVCKLFVERQCKYLGS